MFRNASRRGVIDNEHLTIRSGNYKSLGFELERADHRMVKGPGWMRRQLDIVPLPQHAEAIAGGRQLIDEGGKARVFHVRPESSAQSRDGAVRNVVPVVHEDTDVRSRLAGRVA